MDIIGAFELLASSFLKYQMSENTPKYEVYLFPQGCQNLGKIIRGACRITLVLSTSNRSWLSKAIFKIDADSCHFYFNANKYL